MGCSWVIIFYVFKKVYLLAYYGVAPKYCKIQLFENPRKNRFGLVVEILKNGQILFVQNPKKFIGAQIELL
jgi:hypothetical protein